ncbi:MAG: hypothetical protein ACI8S6_002535, partial [Myxococcota bacterium]
MAKTVHALLSLLTTPDRDSARQGLEVLAALDDPALNARMVQGVSLDSDGNPRWTEDSIPGQQRLRSLRCGLALALLRRASKLDGVVRIKLDGSARIHAHTDLAPLVGLEHLRELTVIAAARAIPGTPLLARLTGLTTLILRLSALDLHLLAGLPDLHTLEVRGIAPIVDLSWLPACRALRDLRLSLCAAHDLSPLSGMDLERLHIFGGAFRPPLLEDLSPLAALTGLRYLGLSGLRTLSDLRPLRTLTSLRTLHLEHNTMLTDLSPLSALAGLHALSLRGTERAEDLRPLRALTELIELNLRGCAVEDVSPLAALPHLRTLDLS